MFDEHPGLRPLKGAAHLLASFDGWGALYDASRLARNDVRVSAATCVFSSCPGCVRADAACRYVDDMYVDYGLAQDTARAVRGTEQFVTNQMFHDGLRKHTEEVVGKLFEISRREYH